MRLATAFLVATLCGGIALSYEILWFRAYGFMTEGEPNAFGYLLCAYLTGLAFGALFARRYCHVVGGKRSDNQLQILGWFLLGANLLGYLAIPTAAHVVSAWAWQPEQTLVIFCFVAALLGTSFPLLAHFGIPPDDRAGARLSYLYAGNILGSSVGSLTTGFLFLDLFSLQDLSALLATVGVVVSGLLILRTARPFRRFLTAGALILAIGLVSASAPDLYDAIYEKLQYQDDYYPGRRFAHVYENKSGVVTVSESGTVYGGGSYDGQFNVDPRPGRDDNRVLRAYLIAGLHEAPRDILMIGLGSGSWLQVLANHPDVRSITVIEINPGYVEAMRDSPVVASAVDHPSVDIIIDDGRRYLTRTDRRFDVIVQNTIVHWRGHATNLLSREYMELSRSRLEQGGFLFYNSTASTAAQKTGSTVFPYARRFQNMIIASDSPIHLDEERWFDAMERWTIDGRSVFPDVRESPYMLAEKPWRGIPTWEERDALLARTDDAPLITDDNMVTEWWAYDTYP